MNLHRQSWLAFIAAVAVMSSGTIVRCQETRQFRPEVELLVQSVAEKLDGAADELKLTAEQRSKIKEAVKSFEGERTALREQRRSLIESDLKAIAEILTPEQREKAKSCLEDRAESRAESRKESEGPVAWERGEIRETASQKLQQAAEQLALTPEQRTKIRERLEASRDKYREQRHARRELVESEFKAIAEILTPEQRMQAQQYIEQRVIAADLTQSVCERIHAAASKLELSQDQLKRISQTHETFEPKYEALADQRRELMQAEFKAVSEILTPEQREQVRDCVEDRVVVARAKLNPDDPEARSHLKETISERLDAAADRLKLNDEQRQKIKEKGAAFAAKYSPQRTQRESLRKEELAALASVLSPEQREKVKDFVADRVGKE